MRLAMLVAVALALSACGPSQVVLRDPNTGQMAQCAADPWANWNLYAATESCARGYEAAGYVRMSQY